MPSPPTDRPRATRRILVFEPDLEGHSQEWLQHLVDFVVADPRAPALSILAPASLCEALARSQPPGAPGRVGFIALSEAERQACGRRPLSLAAFARWWVMRRHVRQSGADLGFFLSLDLLTLPLALRLGAHGRPLAGILFRPSVHYAALGNYRPAWSERLRDLRKDVLYRLALSNPAMRSILSLDPFFPFHARHHYRGGRKVEALPDPAHPAASGAAASPREALPPDRLTFLLFGYLTERKGPLVVLEALARLPDAVARRIGVLFAGRIDPAIRAEIERRCAALATRQPGLWLRVDDRRLDEGELDDLVVRSDVVLAPYQRFVGSSGVLLWAARAGRPVLAQDYGLVGRLTREHRLGATADSSDPAKLARAIERMVEHGPATFFDRPSARRFVEARTPRRFAEQVLGCVGQIPA